MTDILSRVLTQGFHDGTLRPGFPVRDTAGLLRGILYGTTRHSMLGIIDVPLSRRSRRVEGYCLKALSPGGGAGRKRGKGGKE